MILNTSTRTDIPAYYSEWFYNRIKEGYALTRNPFNPAQILRYELNPEVVDCLSFCTKNPAPMIERLDEIRQFGQFWQVTITPYGKDVEPFVPSKEEVMTAFQRLSRIVGIQSVSWRYDPVLISDRYSLEFHRDQFEQMARTLSGYTDNCVISFIDLYAKTKRNFPGVRGVTMQEQLWLGKHFAQIGEKCGILIKSCCEGTHLEQFGIDSSGCMSKSVIERAIGNKLNVPAGKKAVRESCSCLLGNDIGMYNTCGHGCLYCYANYDRATVIGNRKKHDPKSPLLIGNLRPGEEVKAARQQTFISGQLELF